MFQSRYRVTHQYSVYKRPTLDLKILGLQIKSEGMEKYFSQKWMSKENWSTTIHIRQSRLQNKDCIGQCQHSLPNLLTESPTTLCFFGPTFLSQSCLCPSGIASSPRRPAETPMHTMSPNLSVCKASVLVYAESVLIYKADQSTPC